MIPLAFEVKALDFSLPSIGNSGTVSYDFQCIIEFSFFPLVVIV